MDADPYKVCNNTYIPTSTEYYSALGAFNTTILVLGSLVTVGLFILFFEQVVYTNQTAHNGVKRHISWITSVFPVMTTMSLVAMCIPRAQNVCQCVKMVYMSIGISHFTDLTMVLFGGDEMLVEQGCHDTFNLQLGPVCCCCRCLPRPPVTKYSLRLVVLLTDQLPFAQAIYYIIVSILLSADNITMGDVEPSGAFLWLNLFKLTSAMCGVFGFMILSNFSRGYLDDFGYRRKSRCINILILITNLQSMILNIMANYGVFPCIPPYVSSTVYKMTVDNSLYLVEMMILGPYSYWQYHDLSFSTPFTELPFYRSRTGSGKDNCSTTGTITTTVTAIENHSDTSDDDEHSGGGGSNSKDSKDSARDKTAVINIDAAEENGPAADVTSKNITRRSRSRSSKRNSTRDSTNDSIRRGKKSTTETTRNSIRENSTNSKKNNNRDDSTRRSSRRSSKQKAQRSVSDIGHDTKENNGNSENSTKEESASSGSTNSSTDSTLQRQVSQSAQSGTELIEFEEDQSEC